VVHHAGVGVIEARRRFGFDLSVSLTFAPGLRCNSITTEFRMVSNAFTGRFMSTSTATCAA
jgi:hypothetical protein